MSHRVSRRFFWIIFPFQKHEALLLRPENLERRMTVSRGPRLVSPVKYLGVFFAPSRVGGGAVGLTVL